MFTIAVIVIAVALLPTAIDTVLKGLRLLGRFFTALKPKPAPPITPAQKREELFVCGVFLVSAAVSSELLKRWGVDRLQRVIISLSVSLLLGGGFFLVLEFLKFLLQPKSKESDAGRDARSEF